MELHDSVFIHVRWVDRSILHMDPLSYFSFQPLPHKVMVGAILSDSTANRRVPHVVMAAGFSLAICIILFHISNTILP